MCVCVCVCAYPATDVAVMIVCLQFRLSCAIVPAIRIEMPNMSFTSSSHLRLGLPLSRLPAVLPSSQFTSTSRYQYNLLCSAFKSFYFNGPEFLKLMPCANKSHNLRSKQQHLISTPTADFTFSFAAASKFNNLPESLRRITNFKSFKTCVKTFF